MKSSFSHRVTQLIPSLWLRTTRHTESRQPCRPALECLEARTVPSTLSVVNLNGGASAHSAVSSGVVYKAVDVPQRVDFLDVFTTSFVNVPQSLIIASLKVQLDLTYPLDNDLTIDLIAPDGTDVSLSAFEGTGANFQNTTFDDSAATPIWAGNSPFTGSYQPEGALSALAGTNARGTWQLQIIDWGASSGTLSSWSLIIQPAGSPNAVAPQGGIPRLVTAPSPSLMLTDALPPTFPAAGNPLMAGQTNGLTTQPAAVAPNVAGVEPVVVSVDVGSAPSSRVHVPTGSWHDLARTHDLSGTGGSGGPVNGLNANVML
jgi:subtilisin-like proprotein convertase family protein